MEAPRLCPEGGRSSEGAPYGAGMGRGGGGDRSGLGCSQMACTILSLHPAPSLSLPACEMGTGAPLP